MDITLTRGADRAPDLLQLHDALDNLALDKAWAVNITQADNIRRTIQNDLMWVWHGQWADFCGHKNPAYAHGATKLDLLLPIKLASESKPTRKSAVFEQRVLSYIPDRDDQVGAAYRLVRSKGIPLRVFAAYLSTYQNMAAEQGCILTSDKQMLNQALMTDRLREAERRG